MDKKPRDEAKQTNSMNAVLMVGLLVLSVAMIRTAFSQFFAHRVVGGCINSLGGLLFFSVSMMLLKDVCNYMKKKEDNQEDSTNGF